MKKVSLQFYFLRYHIKEYFYDVTTSLISWISVGLTIAVSIMALLPNPASQNLRLFFDYIFASPWWIAILALIILIALIVNWPKMRATYHDPRTNFKIIIECCDIFKQEGLKVIHSVDTFDSELNTIISPNSLHGKFLLLAKEKNIDINKQIEQNTQKLSYTIDADLPQNKKRFALGSLCPINLAGNDYCLASFTHLQSDGSIKITEKEYIDFLLNLWNNLAEPTIKQDIVNVAVMGNKFVDLPADYSTEQKIDLMLQTFFVASRQKTCCKTLRICVHENNATEIDFAHYNTIIEHLSKRPVL